jgi:hypothetical protein
MKHAATSFSEATLTERHLFTSTTAQKLGKRHEICVVHFADSNCLTGTTDRLFKRCMHRLSVGRIVTKLCVGKVTTYR